jgi:hypothetical protein
MLESIFCREIEVEFPCLLADGISPRSVDTQRNTLAGEKLDGELVQGINPLDALLLNR